MSLLLWASAAQAGAIVFDGFDMTTNFQANLTLAGNLQLIPDSVAADGSAFGDTAISTTSPFTYTFSYSISNGADDYLGGSLGLADGLAFVLQNDTNGPSTSGGNGYAIGYGGITPSLAIALRTWATNDIEIDEDGNLGGSPSQLLTLNGGGNYGVTDTGTITVSYDGVGTLTVTGTDNVAGDPAIDLSTSVNLATLLGPTAYVGFTGGSGSGWSDEEITSFSSMPEPSTALLAIPALLGLAAWRRRRSA